MFQQSKPVRLRRFVCTCCGAEEKVSGGTTGFLCSKCKEEKGHYTLGNQYLAHKAVADAIKSGSIDPPSNFACVDCGGKAIEYDHRDYERPLFVDPVCRRCNLRRGPALNFGYSKKTANAKLVEA